MIKPKKSGLGKQKRFFNEIESVAISLNFLKNKFQVIYDESLDLINGIVRNLHSFNKNRGKENMARKTEIAIIKKLDDFELNHLNWKHAGLKMHLPNLSKKIKKIAYELDTLSEREVNDIRGLLTEAVACSFLGDVRAQNNLIWDCSFFNNKCISVGKTKTTDIYYKDFHVHLYECKTKPYFKTAQFDFMCKVQEEYAKEGTQVSLFTFVLQYSHHPTFDEEIRKIPNHFEIKTLESLKQCH